MSHTSWRDAVDAHLPALDFWAKLTPTLADDAAVSFVRLARENPQVGAILDALLGMKDDDDVETVAMTAASPEAREAMENKAIPWATLIQLLPVILALFKR